ncbi:MAG: hypothetical protein J6N19_17225, partial [Clostridium sp.]|nr:hypothetical protein [Clostridium sp.]
IAKSGFADDAEKDEFIRFISEKIADAKEHPENYPTEKELEQKAREEEAAKEAEERERRIAAGEITEESAADEDAPQITRVDTSRMGSIGKLAHMVTADVEDAPEEAPEAAAETAEDSTEAAAETREDSTEAAAETVEKEE